MTENLRKLHEAIETYIRPATFPVAIKLLRSETEIPKGIESASKVFGHRVTACQGWSMARHNGEALAILKDSITCPPSVVGLGLIEPPELVLDGTIFAKRYTANKEAAARMASAMPRFPVGEYVGLVTAPVQSCNFQPDMVLIYCNPLQAKRLIHAALSEEGGTFASSQLITCTCPEVIPPTIQTGRCQFAIPGMGNRVYEAVSADEVVFTIPGFRLEEIANGLRYTHGGGVGLPPKRWIDFEVRGEFGVYNKVMELLTGQKHDISYTEPPPGFPEFPEDRQL